MRAIKVYFANGDTLCTSINGTEDEIRAYYLNNTFNLGNDLRDVMTKAIRVEFL